MKVGLVLEGGGSRGAYTAGVLDCFIDNDITFDKCYGVSAGAINGASFVTKQKGRSLSFWRDCITDKNNGGIMNLFKTGYYFKQNSNEGIEALDLDAYLASKMKFEAVLTNVKTGETEYIEIKDANQVDEIVTASASLPIFSRFNDINGKYYLDGGLGDSIPAKRAMDDGMDKILCILTQHKGFVKKKTKSYYLAKVKYRRYPKLVELLKNRHIMYNSQLDYIYGLDKNKCMVLQPKEPVELSRLEKDKKKVEALYNTGYQDALNRIEEIKAFINNN